MFVFYISLALGRAKCFLCITDRIRRGFEQDFSSENSAEMYDSVPKVHKKFKELDKILSDMIKELRLLTEKEKL